MTHNSNNTADPTADQDASPDILTFLRWLYGDDAPGWLSIWTLPDKATGWYPAHRLVLTAKYALTRATTDEVYFGLGLRQAQLADGRGDSDDVLGIPGFWIEIDFKHDVHTKVNLPPTIDEALSLVQEALPLVPTLIIFSGYGIHVYWLFRELWIFEDAEDRQAAYHLLHRLQATIQGVAKLHGWDVDSTFDLARVLRLPGTYNRKIADDSKLVEIIEAHAEQRYNPSDFTEHLIDVDETSYQQPTSEAYTGELSPIELQTLKIPTWLKSLIRHAEDVNATKPYPSRSEALFDAVQGLLKTGVDEPTIMSLALDSRYAISEKPRQKGRTWLTNEIARARVKLNGHRPTTNTPPEPEAPGDERNASSNSDEQKTPSGNPLVLPWSDYTNAVELIEAHGQNLRYCHPAKNWYVWDGKRWLADETAAVMRLATDAIKAMAIRIISMNNPESKALLAHLKTSLSTSKLKALVDQASWLPEIPVLPKELDQHPWLLNCLNGTLDLQTGELQPHRRDDLLTMMAAAEYHPDARSKVWESFLQRILPDESDRRYVQKAAGYSLTGLGTEDVLFFPFGPTKTGKSTLLKGLRATLGDYATTADFETFLTREHVTGAPRADIAGLAGKRLVVSLEVDQGKKLAEALIKWLFGGDYVTARFLYKKEFEFLPTFKLWLASNHRPQVSSDDDAIWERIRQIPFEQTIPKEERDPSIKAELSDPEHSGAAILAWAVEGCLLWQREGLGIPKHVEDTTDAYRKEMDPMPDFIEACLVNDDKGRVLNAAMWECYQTWSRKNRDRPKLGRKTFTQRLEQSGVDGMNSGGYRFWLGVRLRYHTPGDQEDSEKDSDEL